MSIKVNSILAKGLVQEQNFVNNLAEALECNPNLAEILVNGIPKIDAEEAYKLIRKTNKEWTIISDKCLNLEVNVNPDFAVTVRADVVVKGFITKECAGGKYDGYYYRNENDYCCPQREPSSKYTIPVTFTKTLSCMI